ncbi:hypothetical protein BCR43DRAFT_341501 [Syncephalastrum racemosum]|uniref:Uncharacterized protein n=1 Tax=Syncephalastrum racemosum TaxID=13706 RepID=A0A1X2H933_SYNRA|nr:hypothetical protein BCR43DRAFT_341501 [Syncephalastrum racemosum]
MDYLRIKEANYPLYPAARNTGVLVCSASKIVSARRSLLKAWRKSTVRGSDKHIVVATQDERNDKQGRRRLPYLETTSVLFMTAASKSLRTAASFDCKLIALHLGPKLTKTSDDAMGCFIKQMSLTWPEICNFGLHSWLLRSAVLCSCMIRVQYYMHRRCCSRGQRIIIHGPASPCFWHPVAYCEQDSRGKGGAIILGSHTTQNVHGDPGPRILLRIGFTSYDFLSRAS